uniref:Uncharacterized protein n=1 Tax=Ciona intestinalis TaxID=7719 RepID=H2XSR3_CIOIN
MKKYERERKNVFFLAFQDENSTFFCSKSLKKSQNQFLAGSFQLRFVFLVGWFHRPASGRTET